MAACDDVVIDLDGLRMRYGAADLLRGVTFRSARRDRALRQIR